MVNEPAGEKSVVGVFIVFVVILCLFIHRETIEVIDRILGAELKMTPPATKPTAAKATATPRETKSDTKTETKGDTNKTSDLVSDVAHTLALGMGFIGALGMTMGALWTIASFIVSAGRESLMSPAKEISGETWKKHRTLMGHAILFGLGLLLIAEVLETIAISSRLEPGQLVKVEFFSHIGAVLAVVLIRAFVEYLIHKDQPY